MQFLDSEYRNSKYYTKQKCYWCLNNITKSLIENGYDASPYRISEDTINFIKDVLWKDKQPSTLKGYYCYLNKYLLFHGNKSLKKMRIILPQDMRINADWLTDDQTATLLQAKKTPLEEMVIHLELCMGLRSVEVCRLMLNDIHSTGISPYINVRGKGRGNGKYRSVSFHQDSPRVFQNWLNQRAKLVETVRRYDPTWKDPGNLMIWCHYVNKPSAGAYSEMGGSLDRAVIEPLRERLGFHFSNHTLRRTFGRNLFHAKVPLETIMKFLGHSSTSETLKYLGINLDDMDEGMLKLALYQKICFKGGSEDGVSRHTGTTQIRGWGPFIILLKLDFVY